MKRYLVFLLFVLSNTVQTFPQETLQEFVIEKDTSSGITEIFKEYGCTPDDGVIVFNTTIPNLEFSIPDAPNRLKHVSPFDGRNKRYVLCVQPTDGFGGYAKYVVLVNGRNYKPEAMSVSAIKPMQAQYFKINPKTDPMTRIEKLEKEQAELKKMLEERGQQSTISTNQPPQTSDKQSQSPDKKKTILTVSADVLLFNSIDEEKLIKVFTNAKDYKVSFLPKWVKTKKLPDNNLQISCDRNTKEKSRTGDVYIVSGKEKVKINVIQGGKSQQNAKASSNQPTETLDKESQLQQPMIKGTTQQKAKLLNFVFNGLTKKNYSSIEVYLNSQLIGKIDPDKGSFLKCVDTNPGAHELQIRATDKHGAKVEWNGIINSSIQTNFTFEYKIIKTGFGYETKFELVK